MKKIRQHILGYFSSPDRGLIYALKMWPKVIEAYPDAEFHIFYGFELFLKAYSNNPERMAWYNKVMGLMETLPNVHYHGKVGQDILDDWMKKIGIMYYPTDFEETNCIVALSSQYNGCVPCTMNKAGLKDTVGSGVMVDGEIWDPTVREEYLKQLLDLMGDKKRWEAEQVKGKEFVKKFYRSEIAKQWVKNFE
jgi:glycosyltransferase involved in cell wall biosynthesis